VDPDPPGKALSERRSRQIAFARLLGSAIVGQGLLSAASFAVGLILIRSSSVVQYGYYILAVNAILLLASLQNAIFKPPLALRLNVLDRVGRAELVGSLYLEQRWMLPRVGAALLSLAAGLWLARLLDAGTFGLVAASIVAGMAMLHREFFRMVLLAYRRPQDVLRADALHVVLLVAGVCAAILTPLPATMALLAMGLAALASGALLSTRLRRHEPWDPHARGGILRQIGSLAAWSTGGAAIQWTFSQGYIYLVAGTLNIAAVAAIGATRLLMMPMNLLSAGIGSLMLPAASAWLSRHAATLVLRRLSLFAVAMATTTLAYFSIVWSTRDWLFATVLRRQFAQRDELLLLWGAVFLATVVRDQLVHMLAAQGRFRILTSLTLVSAIASLGIGYAAMSLMGVAGALLGLLAGEVISVLGIVILSLRSAQRSLVAAA